MSAGSCKSCQDCSCDETSCDDHECAPAPVPAGGAQPPRQRDQTRYLTRDGSKGPRPDPTPLEAKCNHYDAGSAVRSQCVRCIAGWVVAVGREEAEKTAQEYEQTQRRITAHRIRDAIAEFLVVVE